MSCSGCSFNHHAQALTYISQTRPGHLVLWGNCCSMRDLQGAAPRVTVLGAQLAQAMVPDPADVVYLCGNISPAADDFAKLAAILKPGGLLLFSARYFEGGLPQEDWPGVHALNHWLCIFRETGFAQVESLAERILVFSCHADGEMAYSICEGLLGATKEE